MKYEYASRLDITNAIGDHICCEAKIGQRDLSTPDKKMRATAWFVIVILVGIILCNQIVILETAQSDARHYEWITMHK